MPADTGDVPSDKLGELEISSFGKFIRRTNLDELPQLFNILKGDMSLVGPRPSLPSQHELFALRRRNGALVCRPGLTGLAQVNSFDGMSVEQKACFDGRYAERITLLGDISIVLRTFSYLRKPPPVY
jgi:O-antigen biosynthesis protein WbqP